MPRVSCQHNRCALGTQDCAQDHRRTCANLSIVLCWTILASGILPSTSTQPEDTTASSAHHGSTTNITSHNPTFIFGSDRRWDHRITQNHFQH